MKKVLSILLVCLLCGCLSYNKIDNDAVSYDVAQSETLIRLWSKIIDRGTIEFLSYEDGVYQLTGYSYRIDKKHHIAHCTLRYKEPYKPDQGSWVTSTHFKKHGQQNKSEAYFNCFSEGFFDLTNDEKMSVLEQLSKQ
ncbi:MAG: hypothetical protein J6T94_06305 [Bacteroidaceae bacterium]|nr:hypothetical protein [Bacteroidaceae bacterium]